MRIFVSMILFFIYNFVHNLVILGVQLKFDPCLVNAIVSA